MVRDRARVEEKATDRDFETVAVMTSRSPCIPVLGVSRHTHYLCEGSREGRGADRSGETIEKRTAVFTSPLPLGSVSYWH